MHLGGIEQTNTRRGGGERERERKREGERHRKAPNSLVSIDRNKIGTSV